MTTKKQNALKWTLLIASFVLLVSSCAPQPPDVPVCEDLDMRTTKDNASGHLILKASPTCVKAIDEPKCGHCTYIVSGKEIFVGEKKENLFNGKTWSELKRQSVLVPAEESYAPIATYMINACKKMKCDDDVTRFRLRLIQLDAVTQVESKISK